MAVTVWRIMTARRYLCRWSFPANSFESNPPRERKNLFADVWNRSWKPLPSAWRPPARTLGAAEAASTSTCRMKRRSAIKTQILRETLGRIGRIQWAGPIADACVAAIRLPESRAMEIAREAGRRGGGIRGSATSKQAARGCAPWTNARFFRRASRKHSRNCARSWLKRKILSAIDEVEAFADSADEKILLNLSAERLTDSPESIASALRESLPNVESILIQDRRADKFELFGPGYLSYSAARNSLPRRPSFVFSGQPVSDRDD